MGRRHQRSRRPGARLPEGVVCATRGTVLGNPFRSDRFGHARAVGLHRTWLDGRLSERTLRNLGFSEAERAALERLRQRALRRLAELPPEADMACWCPLTSRWCHVETLLDRAAALASAQPEAIAA